MGTPRRNDAGEITNAVIVSTYYSGDSNNMYTFCSPRTGNALAGRLIVGPGLVIDTDKNYLVFLDALGLWEL